MRLVEGFDGIFGSGRPARERAPWRLADVGPEARRRALAIALALAIEALLLWGLLSLGEVKRQVVEMRDALVTFTATDDDAPSPEPDTASEESPVRPEVPAPVPDRTPRQAPVRDAVAPDAPVPLPPPPAAVLRSGFDLAAMPRRAPTSKAEPAATMGPEFTPSPGDTPRIAGSGPHGEPLYAARWYRKPYQDELAGYLSTARGPGWGLIDCRTADNWRVEDCVVVGESPQGSGIGSAVRSAAWQFKVRPPVKGGRSMVGEWVRIRIYYEIDPASAAQLRFRE